MNRDEEEEIKKGEEKLMQDLLSHSKLSHAAIMCAFHAEKMAIYARFNQQIDVRDEALEAIRYAREALAILFPEDAAQAANLAETARDLRFRLHGAFTDKSNTPLFQDLKKFLRAVENLNNQP